MEQLPVWVEKAGLILHPTKTRIADARQKGGFDSLGYHFERGHRWPRKKSLDKFKEAIRQKTGRLRTGSMRSIVERKRHKLQGRARGRDHQRWPNDYFTLLISLASARKNASRSPT